MFHRACCITPFSLELLQFKGDFILNKKQNKRHFSFDSSQLGLEARCQYICPGQMAIELFPPLGDCIPTILIPRQT